jgi:hypothetical protein
MPKLLRTAFIFLLLFPLATLNAVEPAQWWKEVHQYDPSKSWYEYMTYTSAYFGPNALPVPELYDGRIPKTHEAEFSTDVYWGYGDQTQSFSTRITYTPIPGRLSLSAWGVLAEHYQTTTAVRDQRASLIEDAEETLVIGDLYLSTQIALLHEKKYMPDLNLEIVLKTAASETSAGARYMDTPGYIFDLTAGKSVHFRRSFLREIRWVGQLGFLCYQLNQVHQEDAPLFAGKCLLSLPNSTFEAGVHGYSGWLNQGDRPLVLRAKYQYTHSGIRYFVQYQHAFRDYPYRRLQTGIVLPF